MVTQVDFGAAQTGVGYRLYDASGAFVGVRMTDFVAGPKVGTYLKDLGTPAAGVIGAKWDCDDPDFDELDLFDTTSTAGTGAYIVTITVKHGSTPLQNAIVRLSEGANAFVVSTNSLGVASFSLDAATYDLSITKAGYSFTPTTLVIAGGGNHDYAMTQLAIASPPTDATLCRVTGDSETLGNKRAANLEIVFTLVAKKPTKSERLISGRIYKATTNTDGQLIDSDGNEYLDLQRNDLLVPAGTQYHIVCNALRIDALVTLDAPTFDLGSLAT